MSGPWYHGKSNSGPAREVWNLGDRVIWGVRGRDYGLLGTVEVPPRDPNASETNSVWVQWDDEPGQFCDPNCLITP